jgi:acyl carrier protein
VSATMSNQTTIMNFIKDELIEDDGFVLTENTSLFKNRVLDSLNLISLISFLEKMYQCKINQSEVIFDNLDTVANMIAFMDRKKHGRG